MGWECRDLKMKEEDKLIAKFGKEQPWKVPDGYFDNMLSEVGDKLPDYPEAPKAGDMSLWQRMKPYVYLAAMFAGIWCMMQVFHHASGVGSLSLENPPAHLASYVSQGGEDEILMLPNSLSDAELLDDVVSQYDDIEAFENDFGYDLRPQYDNIVIE